jgi:V/A-type H+-transporting ATPase subunit I
MIDKMKKITMLVSTAEYASFLEDLRELGLVHVAELQHGAMSPELQEAMDKAEHCRRTLAQLENLVAGLKDTNTYTARPADVERGREIPAQVDALFEEEKKHLLAVESLKRDLAKAEPWGEFDRNAFQKLEAAGYHPYYFTCQSGSFRKEWEEELPLMVVSELNKRTYFVVVATECPDIKAEEVTLTPYGPAHYEAEIRKEEASVKSVREALLRLYGEEQDSLRAALVAYENATDLTQVRLNTESVAQDYVKLINGWVLEEKADSVEQFLKDHHAYYEMESPEITDDDVPIQITNNAYSRLFEPILRMYSLPKYRDLDPTVYFAPFFMLFFGLCMGDAGYGLLIMLASFFIYKKGGDMKAYGSLGLFLGGMTVVCGLLTGSFFGIDLSQSDWAVLAPVKHYFISENNFTLFGYSPMMVISVVIGLVQVLLGMVLSGIKTARLYGWQFAVGKLSWVAALILLVLIFGVPACGVQWPTAVLYIFYALLAVAAVGIYLFNSPDSYKKPVLGVFSNLASGVWSTYNMATGLLGDLLSYIRLFALGLTGGVLGSVFNSLAVDMSPQVPVVHELVFLLILLFGHGINFALCMISSFVHPMRLTFVEFFKNADYEGGGKAYNPFRLHKVKERAS